MPQFKRLAFGCVLRIGFMKQKQTPVTETRQSVRNLECTDSLSNIAFNSLSKSKDIEHLPQCNNINSHFVEKIIIVYSECTKPSKTMRYGWYEIFTDICWYVTFAWLSIHMSIHNIFFQTHNVRIAYINQTCITTEYFMSFSKRRVLFCHRN